MRVSAHESVQDSVPDRQILIVSEGPHFQGGQQIVATSTAFGTPNVTQGRGRIYIVCVSHKFLASIGSDATAFFDRMRAVMQRIAGQPCASLSDVLLSEIHPHIMEYYDDLQEQAERSRPRKRTCGGKWVEMHLSLFEKKGLPWSRPDGHAFDKNIYPGLHALSMREFDSFMLSEQQAGSFSDSVVDVKMQVNRSTVMHKISPCVTPTARLFHLRRRRLITGIEALRLQGIHYPFPTDDVLRAASHASGERCAGRPQGFLQDLAGNAFHTGCFSATLFSTLVAFATSRTKASPRHADLLLNMLALARGRADDDQDDDNVNNIQ